MQGIKARQADRWTDKPRCDSVTAASCEWGGFFGTAAGPLGYNQGPCFGVGLSAQLKGEEGSQVGRVGYSHCNKQRVTFSQRCNNLETLVDAAHVHFASLGGNLTKLWLAVWEEDAEDVVSGLVLLLVWDRVWGSGSLRNPLPQLRKHLSLWWE